MSTHEKVDPNQTRGKLDEIRQLALELAARAGAELASQPIEEQTAERRSPGPYGYAGLAKQMYQERVLRQRHFDADLFGEPAWDMLLDLFAQRTKGRQVSITSACIASCVPPTTALRWINVLINRGLVQRISDPRDGRRAFIELTQPALLKIEQYLQALDNSRV